MDSWVILMTRTDSKGRRNTWAMTKSEDDDTMAIFKSAKDAAEHCKQHFLAKASECILINIETGDTDFC